MPTTNSTTGIHTPGPWRGRLNSDDPIDGILIEAEADSRFTVAVVNCPEETLYEGADYRTYTHPDVLDANARLIAAAPAMYQELALAADTFRDFATVLRTCQHDIMAAAADVAEQHIRESLAAIARAA